MVVDEEVANENINLLETVIVAIEYRSKNFFFKRLFEF